MWELWDHNDHYIMNLINNITIFKGKSSLNHIETEDMWELLVGERERLSLEKTLDIKPLRPGKNGTKTSGNLNFQHRITLWLLPHVTTTLEIPSKKYGKEMTTRQWIRLDYTDFTFTSLIIETLKLKRSTPSFHFEPDYSGAQGFCALLLQWCIKVQFTSLLYQFPDTPMGLV